MPLDPPELVIPPAQAELQRLLGAIEVLDILRQVVGLREGDDHPFVVVVVLMVAVAGRRGGLVAGNPGPLIPVTVHGREELVQHRPVGDRFVPRGRYQRGEHDPFAPHQLRVTFGKALGVQAGCLVVEELLDRGRHRPRRFPVRWRRRRRWPRRQAGLRHDRYGDQHRHKCGKGEAPWNHGLILFGTWPDRNGTRVGAGQRPSVRF